MGEYSAKMSELLQEQCKDKVICGLQEVGKMLEFAEKVFVKFSNTE